MTGASKDSWRELFASDAGGASAAVSLRILRRGGVPFLYLPTRNRAAAQALDLYPAQTFKARLAKSVLRLAFRFALLTHGGGSPFALSQEDPFFCYLVSTAGQPVGHQPDFAVLAGNPQAPGRRFVFLLFDAAGHPMAVVKAGSSARAQELINHEAALLNEFGDKLCGFPKLRDQFGSGKVVAFATDFIVGESPKSENPPELEKIFSSWLDSSREVLVREIPAWQRLHQSCNSDSLRRLDELKVHPTLMHGDFAPWNVKVADGCWTVLDWERGERVGIPGWDWFHFIVQPAVLVQREKTEQILGRLEQLFASAEFGRYAKRAGISGWEWPLATAYVNYCLRVTQQTEGAARLESLLSALELRASLTKP